jgi:hypothetical protein
MIVKKMEEKQTSITRKGGRTCRFKTFVKQWKRETRIRVKIWLRNSLREVPIPSKSSTL